MMSINSGTNGFRKWSEAQELKEREKPALAWPKAARLQLQLSTKK